MVDIPHHILFDILLCLPVMSLLRFKSVCKSWFLLIESSDFINEHLKYNGGKEDNLIVLNYHRILESNKPVVELVLHSGSQYENFAHIDFDRLRWHPLSSNILLSGSCNGIICLQRGGTHDVALWNPALNKLRALPPPLFSNRSVKFTLSSTTFGAFGIDVRTNDCKILKIFPIMDDEYEVVGNQVEIYSLRDNHWRIIHENIVLPFLWSCKFDERPPCSNGKCFWMQRRYRPANIITFDFTDEVFGETSLPDGEYDSFDPCKLDIYNDKIVYIRIREDQIIYLKVEIWMLCEGGPKDSWTKLYMTKLSSPPLGMKADPIGLSKNGEYFICKAHRRRIPIPPKLYLYNLHTKEEKFLGFYSTETVRYNPSLISVTSANEI